MRKLVISSILLLLMFSVGWSNSVTVRPTKSRGEAGWLCTIGTPCSTCVNDQNNATSVYAAAGSKSGFAFPDFITQQYFDSLQLFVRANTLATGSLAFGWGCFDSEFSKNHWAVCNWTDSTYGSCNYDTGRCSGADTITLTTTITDYYVITLLYDPHTIDGWDTTYYNNSTYGSWHQSILNLFSVSVSTKGTNYVYEIWGNLYWTPGAVLPRMRQNIIDGGIIR